MEGERQKMESNTQNTQNAQVNGQLAAQHHQAPQGFLKKALGQFATKKYWKDIFTTVLWSLIAGFFVALGSVFVSLGNTKLKERVGPQSLAMIQHGMHGTFPGNQNTPQSHYQNMQNSFHQQNSFVQPRPVTGGFGTQPPVNHAPHPATQFPAAQSNNFTFISPKSPSEGGSPFPT